MNISIKCLLVIAFKSLAHLGRLAVEHLLGGEQCLQIGDQEQDARVVQCGQLVVQLRVQDLVGSPRLLQLLAAFGDLGGSWRLVWFEINCIRPVF